MLRENQVYELTVITPYGVYTYRFATRCWPLYSTYEQLLLDTGTTPEQLDEFDALRYLHQASLICDDILERAGKEIPDKPDLAMRQYTRFRAARDVLVSRLRGIVYSGRGAVSQRLADLTVERRPAVTANELEVTVRNLEREVAYWEARLRGSHPIAYATRGGTSYPFPLPPRTV